MNLRVLLLFLLFSGFMSVGFSGSYSSCATLGTGYNTLSGDVAAGGYCFFFNSNTELDCKGYTITGSGSYYALLANINKDNLTIRNCEVTNFQLGTYIVTSTNIKIINSTFYGNDYGIYAYGSNSNIHIENSSTYSNSFHGVFLGGLDNSNFSLTNHLSYGNTNSGVNFYNVDGIFVKNLTSYSNLYGLYMERSDGVNVSDINLYNNYIGLLYSNSTNGIISDISINNSPSSAGILLQKNARNSVFKNIVSDNSNWGVIYQGYNVSFDNLSADKNSVAFYIVSGDNALVINSNFTDSSTFDVRLDITNKLDMCSHNFSNVIGSLGYPLKYFNSSVSLSNEVLSQLILCDADNSNITNVSIYEKEGSTINGLMNYFVDDSNFTDLKFNNSGWGLYFINSNRNIINNVEGFNGIYGISSTNSSFSNYSNLYFRNMTFSFIRAELGSNFNRFVDVDVSNSSDGSGILIAYSDDNYFSNVNVSYSMLYHGFYLLNSSRNIVNNLSSSFNFLIGLVINTGSDDTVFEGQNYLFNNTDSGALFGSGVGGLFSNFTVYNNNLAGFVFSEFDEGVFSNINILSNKYEGIYLEKSDSNNFTNVVVNSSKFVSGVYLKNASYNNFNNLNSSFNFLNGVVVYNDSNFNDFDNINSFNNSADGFLLENSYSGIYSDINLFNNVLTGLKLYNFGDAQFINVNSYSNSGGALFKRNSNNLILDSLNFSNNLIDNGIYITNSSNISIINSNFDFNKKNGFVSSLDSIEISLINSTFKSNLGAGVAVGVGSNVSIVNSDIYSNLFGVFMENSSNNYVYDSRVLGNVGGIYFNGDTDDSEVFNNSVYNNFLGDVYFSGKSLIYPENNILFGNTFDTVDKIMTNVNFSDNVNFFNSTRLGFGDVGNYWTDFSCFSTDSRGNYLVCLDPVNLLIDLEYNIFDYAPLSNHPGLVENVLARKLDYVYPTFPDGTRFSKSNFIIKFGDGVTDISPCLVKVNNIVGSVSFSDGYCTLLISDISGSKSDIKFQAYSSQFTFEERIIHHYPNPNSVDELFGFNFLSILLVLGCVGLFLW
jgi:hypothetical protein